MVDHKGGETISPKDINHVIENAVKLLLDYRDKSGAFIVGGGENKSGCFSTIEGVFPLLLYVGSISQKNNKMREIVDTIANAIRYLLDYIDVNNYPSPDPYYPTFYHSLNKTSVDVVAYCLYVLNLARIFFERYGFNKDLLQRINETIPELIKYIDEQRLDDGGWSIEKNLSNQARIYSTALCIFSLSMCRESDFKNAFKENQYIQKKDRLYGEGIRVLLDSAKKIKDDEIGWGYTKDDNPNPYITSVVAYTLSWFLLSKYKIESGNIGRIEEALKACRNYLLQYISEDLIEKCRKVMENRSNLKIEEIQKLKQNLSDKEKLKIKDDKILEWEYCGEMAILALLINKWTSLSDPVVIQAIELIKSFVDSCTNIDVKDKIPIYHISIPLMVLIYGNLASRMAKFKEELLIKFFTDLDVPYCINEQELPICLRDCEYKLNCPILSDSLPYINVQKIIKNIKKLKFIFSMDRKVVFIFIVKAVAIVFFIIGLVAVGLGLNLIYQISSFTLAFIGVIITMALNRGLKNGVDKS